MRGISTCWIFPAPRGSLDLQRPDAQGPQITRTVTRFSRLGGVSWPSSGGECRVPPAVRHRGLAPGTVFTWLSPPGDLAIASPSCHGNDPRPPRPEEVEFSACARTKSW